MCWFALYNTQVSVTCVLWCKAAFGLLLCPWKLLEPLDLPLTADAAVHSSALGFPTPPVPVTMLTQVTQHVG